MQDKTCVHALGEIFIRKADVGCLKCLSLCRCCCWAQCDHRPLDRLLMLYVKLWLAVMKQTPQSCRQSSEIILLNYCKTKTRFTQPYLCDPVVVKLMLFNFSRLTRYINHDFLSSSVTNVSRKGAEKANKTSPLSCNLKVNGCFS